MSWAIDNASFTQTLNSSAAFTIVSSETSRSGRGGRGLESLQELIDQVFATHQETIIHIILIKTHLSIWNPKTTHCIHVILNTIHLSIWNPKALIKRKGYPKPLSIEKEEKITNSQIKAENIFPILADAKAQR